MMQIPTLFRLCMIHLKEGRVVTRATISGQISNSKRDIMKEFLVGFVVNILFYFNCK